MTYTRDRELYHNQQISNFSSKDLKRDFEMEKLSSANLERDHKIKDLLESISTKERDYNLRVSQFSTHDLEWDAKIMKLTEIIAVKDQSLTDLQTQISKLKLSLETAPKPEIDISKIDYNMSALSNSSRIRDRDTKQTRSLKHEMNAKMMVEVDKQVRAQVEAATEELLRENTEYSARLRDREIDETALMAEIDGFA